MKTIDIDYVEDAAKWGLTDFYPESEKKFRNAVLSGDDFSISYECKKEIRYASVIRENDAVTVTVTSCMDDLLDGYDLIYDALWSRCHSEDELPDEILEDIREEALDCWLSDESTAVRVLPVSASFEDICTTISELENESEEQNNIMFNILCDIVEAYYKLVSSDDAVNAQ